MMLKKWMWSAGAIAAMALFTAQPAQAALVTYQTTGTFQCGTAVNCAAAGNALLIDGVTGLLYTGVTATRIFTGVTNASFGRIDAFESVNNAALLDGALFTLTITQVAPPGSGDFSATLTGTINSVFGSTAYLEFDPAQLSLLISPFVYSVVSADTTNPGRVNLNPVGESTAINGVIRAAEPGSMLLFGTALFGLGGIRRRFRLQA